MKLRHAAMSLLFALAAACSGSPESAVDANVGDGAPPDVALEETAPDGGTPDAPTPDTVPPIPCKVHHDCPQGSYCYYKTCVADPDYPVYHCNKKDAAGSESCPPGHWCVQQDGKKSVCAESTSYTCKDACDCGPAHCCVDVAGTKRCVKDTADPYKPGGTAVGGAACVQGKDPTYCATDPTCHEGRQVFANKAKLGSFLAYSRELKRSVVACGGKRCFGTACNCKPGQQCVDTLQAAPAAGKACLLLSGGSCVSSALAETIFGIKPADQLPCCSASCPKGKPCDAGWISTRKYAYQRVVGTCGAVCGDKTCDPSETINSCAADCSCGDKTCDPGEAKTCPVDCASCGNKVCDPGEISADPSSSLPPMTIAQELVKMGKDLGVCLPDCICGNGVCDPGEVTVKWSGWMTYKHCPKDCSCGDGVCSEDEVCPQDCVCADAHTYTDVGRRCGDGACNPQGCGDLESCLTCPLDCKSCTWELVEREGRSDLPSLRAAAGAWGDPGGVQIIVGETNMTLGAVLQYDGAWSAHQLPFFPMTQLATVWGAAATEVYAASRNGHAYRYDGASWRPMAQIHTSSSSPPVALWGRAAGEVYVVADTSLKRHDGNALLSWSPVGTLTTGPGYDLWGPASPSDDLYVARKGGVDHCRITTKSCSAMFVPAAAEVRGIWGHQSGWKVEVFAVGAGPAAWRYDDNPFGSWTKMSLPSASGDLLDVWGRSASEVYAVGEAGLILRYDGKTWTKTPTPVQDDIVQVWGDAKHVQALVGVSGAILRYDPGQATWKLLTSPSGLAGSRASRLARIWGASATEVFAVSGDGVVRYDGKTYKPMSLPTAVPLYGVHGGSGADVMAVGGEAGGAATVLSYNGTAWSKLAAPAKGPLLDVIGANTSYHAVGLGGGEIWHYDGSTWKAAATVSGTTWLSGIASCSATKLAVVGHNDLPAPFFGQGRVALYDTVAKSWTPATVAGVTHLWDVWCDGSTIVATGAEVERFSKTFESILGVSRAKLKLVTCAAAGSGLTCKVLEPDLPPVYRDMSIPGGLQAIWGSAANDLVVAGLDGTLLHYNGKELERLRVDIRSAGHNSGCADLLGLWGASNDLFVNTAGGLLRLQRAATKP